MRKVLFQKFELKNIYVIFKRSDALLAKLFLKRDCAHAYLVLQYTDGSLTIVNPAKHRAHIWAFLVSDDKGTILNDFDVKRFYKLYSKDKDIFDVVKVKQDKGLKSCPFIGIGNVGCAMVVKYILGINKTFIFTPYQLYKYLIKKEFV